MNTSQLSKYAPAARKAFIAAVSAQAARLGITAQGNAPAEVQGDVLLVGGQAFPGAIASARKSLVKRVQTHGFEATMEAIAYTWFNRFVAIRYMELHGYLDHGYRVLSGQGSGVRGQGLGARPEILDHAADVELPGLAREKVIEMKLDGTKDEELYRLLLKAQCNALHQAMPFLFEAVGAADELLLPANLLHTDSLIRQLVEQVDEALWQEIEIIGWLYQFYISEKKDQVIGKVVRSEDIPAATQLFTPNWIVKYMVQNSLGAQWLATYPNSPLKGQMEYYIEPAEQTPEVKRELQRVQREWLEQKALEQQGKGLGVRGQGLGKAGGSGTSDPQALSPNPWPLVPSTYSLSPEHLTLIDPACGSGHILVEAYDLFRAIYLERGYRPRDVAKLILEKNLFGLDIDERAAQLTGFALMMKGRADDRRLFERGVKLNVLALRDSEQWTVDSGRTVASDQWPVASEELAAAVDELVALFEHATTFGSLIQVPEELAEKLAALERLSEANSQDLFVSDALKRLGPLVQQAKLLAAQYDAVVANPPYIGIKFHTAVLKKFLKDHYKGYERDVFSAFIDRDLAFSKQHGHLGFMSPFVWMFISSHEHLRNRLVGKESITSLVQLEYSGFEGATVPICTFTLQNGHVNGRKGCYIRLSDFRGSDHQGPKTLEAIQNRDCGWLFETAQDEFKKIPGSPVAYWASEKALSCFSELAVDESFTAKKGMAIGDNARFLRVWQEVGIHSVNFDACEPSDTENQKWYPCLHGGSFRKWGSNREFIVNWVSDGKESKEAITSKTGDHWSRYIISTRYFFLEGVNWSAITSGGFSARYHPSGFAFTSASMGAFSDDYRPEPLLAMVNSEVGRFFFGLLSPTLNYGIAELKKLPLNKAVHEPNVAASTKNLVSLSISDWDAYERSWDFAALPLLSGQWSVASDQSGELATGHSSLATSYTLWVEHNRDTIAKMKRLEEENNRLFIDAYGLADELTPDVPIEQITLTVNPAYRYGKGPGARDQGLGFDDMGIAEELWVRFRLDTMKELVSYAIGCMMGRYRLDRPGLIYAHSGGVDFEKIYFRGQGSGARGQGGQSGASCAELSRSDRLAESDGPCGTGVSHGQDISAGREVWADQSGSASRGVDPLEYSGGACSKLQEGVSEFSLDRPGIHGRGGDADHARRETGIRYGETDRGDHGTSQRDLSDVGNHQEETNFGDEGLGGRDEGQGSRSTPNPWPLTPGPYQPDDDGIVPLTDTEWFEDDAAHRLIEFIAVAFNRTGCAEESSSNASHSPLATSHYLEQNLTFLADNLSPKKNESSRETIRRYLCDSFFKDHLKTYKKRPIYWLFSSGRQKAFQCLVYLHRYNEGTLSRMRSEYVIPLQGKMAARLEKLQDDIQAATSTAQSKRLEKERAKLEKQQVELLAFDEKLRHYADRRISLDLDDGVKVNYGKFGDLLAEVKAVHGKKAEGA